MAVMKKPDEKPMLYVEDFSLSEHIAIGCKLIDQGSKDFTTPNACCFDYGGITIFASAGVCGTGIIMQPDTDPMFCYHGPSPDKVVFSS